MHLFSSSSVSWKGNKKSAFEIYIFLPPHFMNCFIKKHKKRRLLFYFEAASSFFCFQKKIFITAATLFSFGGHFFSSCTIKTHNGNSVLYFAIKECAIDSHTKMKMYISSFFEKGKERRSGPFFHMSKLQKVYCQSPLALFTQGGTHVEQGLSILQVPSQKLSSFPGKKERRENK